MGGEPLCPSPKVWRLGLIAWLYDRIIIHLEARRQSVPCPQCGVKSSRVHSRAFSFSQNSIKLLPV